jgi:RNA polymerase sigma-70 factor (ECF subfamily)
MIDQIPEMPLDECDKAAMVRLASGHENALNELMERHSAKLFNYINRCLQNEEDADDLAQESFVRVYQNRGKFDPRQRFSTWLYAIATNLVKDRYRYRLRHPHVSLDTQNETTGQSFSENLREGQPTPSQSIQVAERADAIRKAVGLLPEDLRTPLILSEYEEMSQAEIGVILNCSAKAVETRIYRARKLLRSSLSHLLD